MIAEQVAPFIESCLGTDVMMGMGMGIGGSSRRHEEHMISITQRLGGDVVASEQGELFYT